MIHLHVYKNLKNTKQQSKKLLLENLSCYLHKAIDESDIKYNKNGKPIIKDVHFSVSHSKDVVVQVFTENQALGVDVECVNNKRSYLALAKRYYHQDEFSLIQSLNDKESCYLFYQLWSLKEAVCKAQGGRLWYYLSHSYLDKNNQVKKSMNGMTLTVINEIKDYSMAIASFENTQIKVFS